MRRSVLLVAALALAIMPVVHGPLFAQDGGEFTITADTPRQGWVYVTKKQRVGAGETQYYIRTKEVISVRVEWPNVVHVELRDNEGYRLDFISRSEADKFARELVQKL
ncbi:MAG: hypothetical protein MAG453_02165 [Calditrichaeota bacterium]|nr:hypothetical protein [Calditrichota bacterium]